jgi:hypothetical protein
MHAIYRSALARWGGVLRSRLRSLAFLLATLLGSSDPVVGDDGLGRWSALAKWPLIPIHAVLLGDGRVMTYGTNPDGMQTARFFYDVWSPRLGLGSTAHRTLPNTTTTDLFCGTQLVLPGSGDVLLAGGDTWNGRSTTMEANADTVIFDPDLNVLTQGAAMQRARWYATATTLPDGRTYIQGGLSGADRPEIRSADGSSRLLDGIDTSSLYWYYPRNFVAPDGRIFGYVGRRMYWIDPNASGGSGRLTEIGYMPADGPNGVTSSEVLYAPGRILRVGGGAMGATVPGASTSAAAVIDIDRPKPSYTRVAPMPLPLHWANATVIPDGRVVVTGGSQENNQLVGVSRRPLIWDPRTGSWTQGRQTGAGPAYARLYHSTAILLLDGTILVGGGGAYGPTTNTNAQLYYPPYLYTAAGTLASRPRIMAGPARLPLGRSFGLSVSSPTEIRRVTLIKTGSATHSFNVEQRFLELSFIRTATGLLVQTPASPNLAPPGRYMLFVINDQGVPSLGRMVSL